MKHPPLARNLTFTVQLHLLSCLMLGVLPICVKCSLQYNLLSFRANSCPFSSLHSHTTQEKQLMWYTLPAVLITSSFEGIVSPQLLHFVPNNLREKREKIMRLDHYAHFVHFCHGVQKFFIALNYVSHLAFVPLNSPGNLAGDVTMVRHH